MIQRSRINQRRMIVSLFVIQMVRTAQVQSNNNNNEQQSQSRTAQLQRVAAIQSNRDLDLGESKFDVKKVREIGMMTIFNILINYYYL